MHVVFLLFTEIFIRDCMTSQQLVDFIHEQLQSVNFIPCICPSLYSFKKVSIWKLLLVTYFSFLCSWYLKSKVLKHRVQKFYYVYLRFCYWVLGAQFQFGAVGLTLYSCTASLYLVIQTVHRCRTSLFTYVSIIRMTSAVFVIVVLSRHIEADFKV